MAGRGGPLLPPPPPPPPGHFGPGGPPGGRGVGGLRPPGMQGEQPFQLPIRPPASSTRYVDLTQPVPLDEDACKERLTTHKAISIRKAIPADGKKEKATWLKCNHTEESLAREEIMKQIKKLNDGHNLAEKRQKLSLAEKRKKLSLEEKRQQLSVTEKKQKLKPHQQSQVTKVIDDLRARDGDPNFEWTLVQIDQEFQPAPKGQKETTVITVYAKKAPRPDINPSYLYHAIEKVKTERMKPQPQPQPQPHPHPQPQPQSQPQPQPSASPVKVGGKTSGKRGRKKYHDDTSSYTTSSSDSDGRSDYSSSANTTISSRSGTHSGRYNHGGRRSRSRSRPREHRRSYIIDDRVPASLVQRVQPPYSPVQPVQPPYSPVQPVQPLYAPKVPRAGPAPEDLAAAYQAGKIDADAERFGLDRYVPPRARPIVYNGYGDRYPLDPRYPDDRHAGELRQQEEDRVWRREREKYVDPFAPRLNYRRYP